MILLILLMLALPAGAEPLSENQSRFGVITGDAGLLTQGAEDWIDPHEGLPLEVGDHIRTGEDGKVELVMADHVLWVLQPRSEVVIEHTETTTGLVDLADGCLIGTVDSKRTVGTVQRWEFNTPAAVIAVRGTEFGITASHQEGTHLGVFSGSVDMQPAETAEGSQPVTEVHAGHETVAARGRPIQTFAKFSAEMAPLAAQRAAVARRQKVIENTWSPFTPSVRKELRDRFVSPAVKHRSAPRIAPRPRRRPSPPAS